MKRKFIIGLLIVFTMFLLTSCSTSTQERRAATGLKRDEFKLYAACDSADDTVTAIFMRDFAKRVEEKTDGKVKIETYANARIGGDSEILEACQNGNISFVFQTTAPQVPYVKQAAILDAPMAFKNLEIARNVLDGKLMSKLNPYYNKKGLELLAIADQSFREMTSNKKIEKMGDLKGIKIRTMENIVIGNPLILSPDFPPLRTVRASFPAYGVPTKFSFYLLLFLNSLLIVLKN